MRTPFSSCVFVACALLLAPTLSAKPPKQKGTAAGKAYRSSVAVLGVLARGEANPTPTAALEDALVREAGATGAFQRVVSPGEITAIMGEQASKGLVQCANDDCSVVDMDLLGVVRTSHLIITSTSSIGSSLVVKMKLLEVKRALEVGTTIRKLEPQEQQAMCDVVPDMMREVVSQAGLRIKAPVPTSPPALAVASASSTPVMLVADTDSPQPSSPPLENESSAPPFARMIMAAGLGAGLGFVVTSVMVVGWMVVMGAGAGLVLLLSNR